MYFKSSRFSWETVIQTDHSSLHALYPENCIKDLKALTRFDKKGMLFLGASRTIQPTTSLFTDEWLPDVSHLFFKLLWTNKQCRDLCGTCSEKEESIPRGAGGLCQLATFSTSHSSKRPCAARIAPSYCLVPSESKGFPSSPHPQASHHSSHCYQNACLLVSVHANSLRPSL